MNIDGSEKRKLNDDWTPQFYVEGDQIYYQNGIAGYFYAIKTDGSGRHMLSDDKSGSIFWNVFDGRIYYNNFDDNNKLYSINIDGSGRKKLSDESPIYTNVSGNRIYYSGKLNGIKEIYSMKTDGSEKVKLSYDNPYLIKVVDDWIYFSNTEDDYKLYVMRTNGENRHKLSDDYALNINVANGRIYYLNGNDQKIYSIKTDGSDRQLLFDDNVEWLVVWNNKIYYTITGAKIYCMNTNGSDKKLLSELDTNTYKDVTYKISTPLRKGMSEYRFVATGEVQRSDDALIGYVMGLKVFDENGNSILSANYSKKYYDQVIGNPVYNEMMDTMGLHVVDVNFDGYKDVIILKDFSGAHGNTWYNCWLWNPKTSSFVQSNSFTEICNPALDPKKKCIYSAGGSGAAFWGGSIYQYINGKFVMTNNIDADDKGLKETKLIKGKIAVVRQVAYTEGDKTEQKEMKYYNDSKLWQLDNPHWYGSGGHHADQWLGE